MEVHGARGIATSKLSGSLRAGHDDRLAVYEARDSLLRRVEVHLAVQTFLNPVAGRVQAHCVDVYLP